MRHSSKEEKNAVETFSRCGWKRIWEIFLRERNFHVKASEKRVGKLKPEEREILKCSRVFHGS
jgi:hypothetical protein